MTVMSFPACSRATAQLWRRTWGVMPGFSGSEHTTWRKAASDVGSSEIRKFGVCLRAGGLAGVCGKGENPLG
jgi:hypothetical protein